MWAVFLKSYLCLGCNFSLSVIPKVTFSKGDEISNMKPGCLKIDTNSPSFHI